MQRYFGRVYKKQVCLDEQDQFHVVKVMRCRVNDRIEVVSEGKVYVSEIKNIKPLEIEVVEELEENNELKNDVVLIVSLLKGDHMDLVIQKATELGVEEIVLLQSERTIAKIRQVEKEYKLERYRKIVKEAAEQSKRTRLPLIYQVIKMDDLGDIRADIKLIAYEGEKGCTNSFNSMLAKVRKHERIAIMIGPEGGFSPLEVDIAQEHGYHKVSLGNRILRAETAAIYALSVIANQLEKK